MEANVARELMMQSRGQFFTVIFKKLDGTYRKLNGRIGVKKYLKDPFSMHELTTKGGELGRVTVYDVKQKGYRSFYLDRIAEIRIRKFKLVNYWDIK